VEPPGALQEVTWRQEAYQEDAAVTFQGGNSLTVSIRGERSGKLRLYAAAADGSGTESVPFDVWISN
jgi:hypothetical protein